MEGTLCLRVPSTFDRIPRDLQHLDYSSAFFYKCTDDWLLNDLPRLSFLDVYAKLKNWHVLFEFEQPDQHCKIQQHRNLQAQVLCKCYQSFEQHSSEDFRSTWDYLSWTYQWQYRNFNLCRSCFSHPWLGMTFLHTPSLSCFDSSHQ